MSYILHYIYYTTSCHYRGTVCQECPGGMSRSHHCPFIVMLSIMVHFHSHLWECEECLFCFQDSHAPIKNKMHYSKTNLYPMFKHRLISKPTMITEICMVRILDKLSSFCEKNKMRLVSSHCIFKFSAHYRPVIIVGFGSFSFNFVLLFCPNYNKISYALIQREVFANNY